MENVADFKEIIDVIKSNGGEAFKLCYQCGLCDAVCPWNRFRAFSMRRIVREATFGMTDIESEEIWLCTTCGSCPQKCPRDVKQIESGVALRKIATEYDVFPQLRQTAAQCQRQPEREPAIPWAKNARRAPTGPRAWPSSRSPRAWRFSISRAATSATTRG